MPARPRQKTSADIVAEWDTVAAERHRQIEAGLDRSFHEILAPSILTVVSRAKPLKALDMGCGSGRLTSLVAKYAGSVTAVDPSNVSIDLAQVDNYRTNVTYVRSSIEKFAINSAEKFDFVYSNMVLMDVSDLADFLESAFQLSHNGAEFHATLTHPFFWPRYSGYDVSEWFDYRKEMHIESPFRISSEILREKTTHIHRPLERYVSCLYQAGFRDVRIREMAGPDGGDPRFLLLSAVAGEFTPADQLRLPHLGS